MPVLSRQTVAMLSVAVLVVGGAFGAIWGFRALGGRDTPVAGFVWLRGIGTRLADASSAALEGWRGTSHAQALRDTRHSLEAATAMRDELREENVFLRTVAELPARRTHPTVPGQVYSVGIVGQRWEALMNVGARDGILQGSAVALDNGALLGIVDRVHERSSSILLIGDPSIQVTARILGTETSGLVRIDQAGQLVLDLVPKDRQVTEGARIISSGVDGLPVGLAIGTVRSVNADHTSLFQRIHIDIAHDDGPVWRAVVFEP